MFQTLAFVGDAYLQVLTEMRGFISVLIVREKVNSNWKENETGLYALSMSWP